MNSPMPKSNTFTEKWYIVDAKDLVLGRMAGRIAWLLQGKMDPQFANYAKPKIHVVIINAKHVGLTGKKYDDSEEECFYWHTGWHGSLHRETYKQTLTGKHPERLVYRAIKRMLPKDSSRARDILQCVRVYAENEHPHQSQSPQNWDLASENRKNTIRGAN